jgi:hypothetical protein
MNFKEFLKMEEANGHGGKRWNTGLVIRNQIKSHGYTNPMSPKKFAKKLFKI